MAIKLGWWVTKVRGEWLFNPAGLHNTVYRFVDSKEEGISTAVDEADAEANLRSIRDAKRQADYVLVHLHTHEWDPEEGLHKPAKFVPPFARACIDANADIFIGQGSHSPLRGIELYKNKPIFYDPGDIMGMGDTVTKLPSDAYLHLGNSPEVKNDEATPADFFDGRGALLKPLNPPGGYGSAPVHGGVVGVCSFKNENEFVGIKLYPFVLISKPRSRRGIPLMADSEMGKKIIDYLSEISLPFGTKIQYREGIGLVNP